MERVAIGGVDHMSEGRLHAITGRIKRYQRQRGTIATIGFLASRLFRFESHVVYETTPATPWSPVSWRDDEYVLQFGPENLNTDLTPELRSYLGGDRAFESLEGVREGDALFVIVSGGEFVHRGYILFKTRQTRLLGADERCPLIAYCQTSAAARGRGLYRRALQAEVWYLLSRGYSRVLIETDPGNHSSRRGIEAAGFTYAWESSVWILFNRLVLRRNRSSNGVQWRILTV